MGQTDTLHARTPEDAKLPHAQRRHTERRVFAPVVLVADELDELTLELILGHDRVLLGVVLAALGDRREGGAWDVVDLLEQGALQALDVAAIARLLDGAELEVYPMHVA